MLQQETRTNVSRCAVVNTSRRAVRHLHPPLVSTTRRQTRRTERVCQYPCSLHVHTGGDTGSLVPLRHQLLHNVPIANRDGASWRVSSVKDIESTPSFCGRRYRFRIGHGGTVHVTLEAANNLGLLQASQSV